MSNRPPQTGLGLSGQIVDPEILTKEIDHDFFDEPAVATATIDFKDYQLQLRTGSKMPNQNRNGYEAGASSVASFEQNVARVGKSFRKGRKDNPDELINLSCSSSNVTVQLVMDRGLNMGRTGANTNDAARIDGQWAEAEAEFYSIHNSNATSPNYPRPKQCYQLQQQRRSIGSIKRRTDQNSTNEPQSLQQVNVVDCNLDVMFADDEMLSSNSGKGRPCSDADSNLSDSTESELDSLDSDGEQLVDMLGKYFDNIGDELDCSDLTEVSPLSSLTASPLAHLFVEGERDGEFGTVLRIADMTLVADDNCPLAGFNVEPEKEALSFRAADMVHHRSTAEQVWLKSSDYSKPQLPLFISTTESIIVPKDGPNGKGDDEYHEDPATLLVELVQKGVQQISGITVNKTDLDLKDGKGKKVSSLQVNGSDISTVGHSNDNSIASFNFSASSLPAKEDYFSRSVSPTTARSLSTGGGNDGHGRLHGSSSTSASSSGSSSRGSGNERKRPLKNFTFTPEQMQRIERENHILLRKILNANSRGQHFHPHAHLRHRNGHQGYLARHNHKLFPISAARLRQQKRIDQENNILMKRLQSVKPSKEIVEAFEKLVVKN